MNKHKNIESEKNSQIGLNRNRFNLKNNSTAFEET